MNHCFYSVFINKIINSHLGNNIFRLQDENLQKLLKKGIAYHHAGLSSSDRILIENSFRKCCFAILLCTTTLSMGVNLPAHLVIIKSTEVYRKGKTEQYDDNTMLQMTGRAGRPQFDTSGTAVIMTKSCNVVSKLNDLLFFCFNLFVQKI